MPNYQAFYHFEERVHEERQHGELSADRLGKIWMEVQTESLGPAFSYDDEYRHFWAHIPHFIHAPFYVYAYAFGDGLVNALYSIYESGSVEFEKNYFSLLSSGGSKHHGELLKPFGLDASDPRFWSKGLNLISSMIDEIESIDT